MRITHYYPFNHRKVKYSITSAIIFNLCLGGYREGETPGPIPNPEAKPLIADNTAGCTCGNVGRCLVFGFSLLFLLLYFTYFYTLLLFLFLFLSIFYTNLSSILHSLFILSVLTLFNRSKK